MNHPDDDGEPERSRDAEGPARRGSGGQGSTPETPPPTQRYREKRDPARTGEPFGPEPLTSGPTWVGDFVVHEHLATARHYDLRLQVGGALKSFAVPRGPSLDPEVRRLAVQTEDHPLEYRDYEGVIPEGNYGAGPMIAWDFGRVRYLEQDAEAGLEKGKLDFELHGHKLRGRFALVRTSDRKAPRPRQPEWLLLKKRDPHARAGELTQEAPCSVLSGLRVEELANSAQVAAQIEERAAEWGAPVGVLDVASLRPAACSLRGAPEDDPRYLYELKLDGVRVLAHRQAEHVALWSRNGLPLTAGFPEVVRALRALPNDELLIDGELVCFDAQGKPDFQRLVRRLRARGALTVARFVRESPAHLVAFDLLQVGQRKLLTLPLRERKQLLSLAVRGRGPVRALEHLEGCSAPLLAFCREHGLEGLIAKKLDSPYLPGPKRSPHWIKIKREREGDFVVVAFTRSEATGGLGALDLATYAGDQLVYRGKVGSGIDGEMAQLLERELAPMRVRETDVEGTLPTAPAGRTFVRPERVVSVRYLGFTDAGHLRHPVFRGPRDDVEPRQCTARPHDELEALTAPGAEDEPTAPASPRPRRAPITNANKVFWPEEGFTKGDLCAYYEAVAPVLLPYLRERPLILVRYPDGIEGKSFYQWNAPRSTPSWVRTVNVRWPERDNREVQLFLADSVDTLVYIANLGCIPLHILAARIGTLSTCDFITIDFDLGDQPLSAGVRLARELGDLLSELGLRGFPKTSGQTGLHVLVPMGPSVSFDTAKALCELLGTVVTARHREMATMLRVREQRQGRLYVDTGQTGTLRAIVAPYSVRAFPGARVSAPLAWDEVGFALDPGRYTMQTLPERVAQYGDVWAGFLDERPDIAVAVERLGELLPR